jgi:hypothetical protein
MACYLRRRLAWCGLFLAITQTASSASGQTTGCPNPQAPKWVRNQIVFYAWDSTIGIDQQPQIALAMATWTASNSTNGSNIVFTQISDPNQATLVFTNSSSLTLVYDPACNLGGFDKGTTKSTVTFKLNVLCGSSPPGVLMYRPGAPGYGTIFTKTALHEVGHGEGLTNANLGPTGNSCDLPRGTSVMNAWPCASVLVRDPGGGVITDEGPNINDWANINPMNVTTCDCTAIQSVFPPPTGGGGGTGGGCPQSIHDPESDGGASPQLCNGCNCSPIVIDVDGDGFDFTNVEDGVVFDIAANGHPQQLSWLSADSDDAFLVLDRNGNGLVDDGSELFGDSTAQPESDAPNGFAALAVFDAPEEGGNGDGKISSADAVYSRLRLWRDSNHNGISEPAELYELRALGVRAIELDYQESQRTDANGNRFRYRARIRRVQGADDGRWAYDVFLQGL